METPTASTDRTAPGSGIEGVWVADAAGRILFAGAGLARLVGAAAPAELVGREWRSFFSSADAARLARARPVAGPGSPVTVTLAAPGGPLGCAVTLHRYGTGRTALVIGSAVVAAPAAFIDGTSRQVMESAADGVCIIDSGRMVYSNRRFEEMTGYTAAQLNTLGLERLVAGRDRGNVTQTVDQTERLVAPLHQELRLVHRSGHEIDCDLRVAPVDFGGRRMLLCFVRDVSQLRRAERARNDMVAMLSHDLRTPLAAIKEAVSLLSETAGPRLDDRQRRYVGIAREEIDRLNRMIENLVEVSRMEAGKVVLRLDAVDLAELISTSIESLSLLVSKRNLTIERMIPHRLPPVLADRDRLLRVFSNVLDNAIKYSPPGGTIRIRIARVEPGAPALKGNGILPQTSYLQVTISDDGPGIPAEFLERVFGKFERVDPYGPGIGLGLAIVRSNVELHHGRVWVESKLGEGASFCFVLPIKEEN